MMRRSLFKSKLIGNTIVYGFTNAIYTGLPLILLPFLVSTLKPEDYGVVELFRSFTLVLIPVLGLSAVQAVGRFYFDLSERDFKTFVTSIQLFQFFTTIGAVLLISVFSFLLSEEDTTLLYLAVVYFFFNQVTESLLIVYRVKEMAVKYLFIRIGNVALELLLMAGLYWMFQAQDWTLRVFPIVMASVGVGILSFCLFRKDKFEIKFSKPLLLQGLKYSAPLILHMLSGYILNIGDRFIIKAFLPAEALGNYAVAYQAGMAVNFFYTSFNLAWTPTFFRWMKEKRDRSIAKVRKLVYIAMPIFGGLLAIFWYFLFSRIDSEQKYTVSMEIVLLVLASYVIFCFYKFETNYFLYNKETNKLSIYTMISAILSLVLNFLLIPKIGIMGAAVSTLLSFICIYLLVLLNKRHVKED